MARTRPQRQKNDSSAGGKKISKYKKILLSIVVLIILSVYAGGVAYQYINRNVVSNDGWNITTRPISFSPLTCFYAALSTSNGIQYAIIAFIVFGILLLAATVFLAKKENLHDERNFDKSERGTYGTSGWMDRKDVESNFIISPVDKAMGTILGIDIETDDIISQPLKSRLNKHIAIYGASGTGKSRCFGRGHIIQCVSRGESIIVTDPKGELYADTAQYMLNNGYDVKVFNLVDPKYSDSWDCLKEVLCDGEQIELMAQTFADVVIKNTMEGGKADHFWDNAEMNLLKALILLVVTDKNRSSEQKNIGEVYRLLSEKPERELEEMFNLLPSTHPAKKPWNIHKQSSESVRGNVVIGLASRIQVFQSPDIINITKFDEIDIEKPAREKCGYFVIMSDQNSTLDFLSSLFFSFMFIRIVKYADVKGKNGACDVPVNFLLDEFPNIGQIPDFTKKLSTIRSRDLRVAVIFQNIAQLQNRYPNGLWQEIIGNCDTQLFLGCTDPETAKFISERTGQMTIKVQSESRQRNKLDVLSPGQPNYSESNSVGKREVLTPDEVLRFPSDQALVILRGQKVFKLRKFDYSAHPKAAQFVYVPVRDHVPEWKKILDPERVLDKKIDLKKADIDPENGEKNNANSGDSVNITVDGQVAEKQSLYNSAAKSQARTIYRGGVQANHVNSHTKNDWMDGVNKDANSYKSANKVPVTNDLNDAPDDF